MNNSSPMLGSRSRSKPSWYCCLCHTPPYSKRTLKRRDQRSASQQIQKGQADRRC